MILFWSYDHAVIIQNSIHKTVTVLSYNADLQHTTWGGGGSWYYWNVKWTQFYNFLVLLLTVKS
jgi:hypothetical protein